MAPRPVLVIENDPRHLSRRGLPLDALVEYVSARGYTCELILPGATSRAITLSDYRAFFDFVARPVPMLAPTES